MSNLEPHSTYGKNGDAEEITHALMDVIAKFLKFLYENYGVGHPKSIYIVIVLGAILGAIVGGSGLGITWKIIGKQVESDKSSKGVASQSTGNATTSGAQSPAVTGNQNQIQYQNPAHRNPSLQNQENEFRQTRSYLVVTDSPAFLESDPRDRKCGNQRLM